VLPFRADAAKQKWWRWMQRTGGQVEVFFFDPGKHEDSLREDVVAFQIVCRVLGDAGWIQGGCEGSAEYDG